jgi:DNA-binding MarR family transcriptional regulator
MAESDDVRQCLCLNLRRSARQITQFYDERLRASGLRTTQFQLLAAISLLVARTGPAAQQPLADLMGMDRTTLTRNLALLERQGYVQVETALRDRRERAIELTPAGRLALDQAMPLWQDAQAIMRERIAADPAIPAFGEVLKVLGRVGTLSEP